MKTKQELCWLAMGYLIAKMDLITEKAISNFMEVIAAEYELKLKKYKDKIEESKGK